MVHIKINRLKQLYWEGKKGRGIPRGYTSRVQAKRMTAVGSKPSPEFPNKESKQGKRGVHSALLSRTRAHPTEVPGSENKGDL